MPRILLSGRTIEVPVGGTIESAVTSEGLHPDAYLYLSGSTPVPMDTVLSEDSEINAIRVASGG